MAKNGRTFFDPSQLPHQIPTSVETLTRAIRSHNSQTSPSSDFYGKGSDAIAKLRELSQRAYNRYTEVDVFGSANNGFGTNTSDLDCFILSNLNLSNPKKYLNTILRILKQRNSGFKVINVTERGMVPLITMRHWNTGLKLKVSFASYNSPRTEYYENTALLKAYAARYPKLPAVWRFLKSILQRNNKFCSTKSGGLSSYAHIIMLIYYLIRGEHIQHIPVQTEPPYSHDEDEISASEGEILLGFLKFYSSQFNSSKYSIDIKFPDVSELAEDRVIKTMKLTIEDPVVVSNVGESGIPVRVYELKVLYYKLYCELSVHDKDEQQLLDWTRNIKLNSIVKQQPAPSVSPLCDVPTTQNHEQPWNSQSHHPQIDVIPKLSNISFDPLVDEPLEYRHHPSRIFDDRSGRFDEYHGSIVMYGLDHKRANANGGIVGVVCDAIWDMGFFVEPDYFSKVFRLSSKMRNSPLVCELKKAHRRLGSEMLESVEGVSKIGSRLITSVKEVKISPYVDAPPQFMLFFKELPNTSKDVKLIVLELCKSLGINAYENDILRADTAIEKNKCIVCTFANPTVAKKLFNFRDFVGSIDECPVKAIVFHRNHNHYYYEHMLLISGLNTKEEKCMKLMMELCEDLGVEVTEEEITRCEWFYASGFESSSPLVVEFRSEETRIAVFTTAKDEAKIRNGVRLHRPWFETSDDDSSANEECPYMKICIKPFLSLPHNILYEATRDIAEEFSSRFVCLPMTFYGRIRLQVLDDVSTTEDVAENNQPTSLNEKVIFIESPEDLKDLGVECSCSALEKYYSLTYPYSVDASHVLEPYEWFSLERSNEKRLNRQQLAIKL